MIPAEAALGNATATVRGSDGQLINTGTLIIDARAPTLFSAAASGRGTAAALVLRVKADGSQQFEPVAHFDAAQNKFIPVPIDLGPDLVEASDQVFLVLFGSGMRRHDGLSIVSVFTNGGPLPVVYAGAQSSFPGLDQLNLRLPRSLSGRGEQDVVINVGARAANRVRIAVK